MFINLLEIAESRKSWLTFCFLRKFCKGIRSVTCLNSFISIEEMVNLKQKKISKDLGI